MLCFKVLQKMNILLFELGRKDIFSWVISTQGK